LQLHLGLERNSAEFDSNQLLGRAGCVNWLTFSWQAGCFFVHHSDVRGGQIDYANGRHLIQGGRFVRAFLQRRAENAHLESPLHS
jgi:hypothetical protein